MRRSTWWWASSPAPPWHRSSTWSEQAGAEAGLLVPDSSRASPRPRVRSMPLALITGAARANSIAAGIVPRLVSDGWDVATSDLSDADYPCDLATTDGPQGLVNAVARDKGPVSALILSHAHDEATGIFDTTAHSFDQHVA